MELTYIKRNIFIFICAYYFVEGAHNFIILPTVWFYVHSLGLSKSWLGLTLGAHAVGNMVFSPILGILADKNRCIRFILIGCLITKVIANILYSIPLSGYFLLCGRFLSGGAGSVMGSVYGEMARYTRNENRAKIFLLVDAVYTVGSSCGPVIGSVVTFNADIFGWKIYAGNSPGIVLIIMWGFLLCVILFLPNEFGSQEVSSVEKLVIWASDEADEGSRSSKRQYYSAVCCLFYLIFSSMFLMSVVSILTPLLATEIFHLKLLHVKLLFVNGTMFMLTFYLALFIASTWFGDRTLLAFSIALQIFSPALLAAYGALWDRISFNSSYSLLFYIGLGIPILSFSLCSVLLSKIAPQNNVSFYQGLCIVISFVAIFAGRSIPPIAFTRTWLLPFSCVLVVLWLVGVLWLCLVYEKLAPDEKRAT